LDEDPELQKVVEEAEIAVFGDHEANVDNWKSAKWRRDEHTQTYGDHAQV